MEVILEATCAVAALTDTPSHQEGGECGEGLSEEGVASCEGGRR